MSYPGIYGILFNHPTQRGKIHQDSVPDVAGASPGKARVAALEDSAGTSAVPGTPLLARGCGALGAEPAPGIIPVPGREGTLSSMFFSKGSTVAKGLVKLTDDYRHPFAKADSGIAVTPRAALRAYNDLLKRVNTREVIAASRTWVAPFAATYKITVVGGGGSGGAGGAAFRCGPDFARDGYGGGGGGAGQVVIHTLPLAKDTAIQVVIGGPGGTSRFGGVAALGGSAGGGATMVALGSSTPCQDLWAQCAPGAAGASYGTSASPGAGSSGGAGGIAVPAVESYGLGGRGGDGARAVGYPAYAGPGTPGNQGAVIIEIQPGL